MTSLVQRSHLGVTVQRVGHGDWVGLDMSLVFVLTMRLTMILHTMVRNRGGVRDRVRFLLFTKQEISQF